MTPSQRSFFLGVVNYMGTAFLLGHYPEYYVVFYLAKCVILLCVHFYATFSVKKHFYMLDFCWCASYYSIFFLSVTLCGVLDDDTASTIFQVMFAFSCGPLANSVIFLQNGLVFHSEPHISQLFIHMSPLALMWAIKFNFSKVDELFPGVFTASIEGDGDMVGLWCYPALLYSCWWLCFTAWMLCDGVSRPKRGYDTVFAFNKAPDVIAKTFGVTTEWKQVLIYMILHACAVMTSMLPAVFFWKHEWAISAFAILVALASVWNGSVYYQRFFSKYERTVNELIEQDTRVLSSKLGGGDMETPSPIIEGQEIELREAEEQNGL